MATIEKRNNSYRIIASCGYAGGRQVKKRMTWTPEPGMTPKQIEKELNKQAVLFEEQCQKGYITSGKTTFSEFSDEWMLRKKDELKPRTYARYESMLPRIKAAIGHIKLDRIQPHHLTAFYENLKEGGIRLDTKFKIAFEINSYLQKNKLSKAEFGRLCGVSASTLTPIFNDGQVSKATADKVADALGMPLLEVFDAVGKDKPLADKTILHHHRLISVIMQTAVYWGVLFSNPCDRTKPPKVAATEPKYLDEEQAAVLLDLLENEDMIFKMAIRTLLFTGLRRGELLGLEWSDINFKTGTMQIMRNLLYLPEKGIYTDTTKTATSKRFIKLSNTVLEDLRKYKVWQLERRFEIGDKWENANRVFTNPMGKPLNPDVLTGQFREFMKKHSELPYITLHSLRHTNATLQVAGGVPVTTIAKRLGHSNSSTTMKIYAHAIESADAAAAETLDNLLSPLKSQSAG